MTDKSIVLVGVPADTGSWRKGCLMGPDALRTANIFEVLSGLGFVVWDAGDLHAEPAGPIEYANDKVHHLADFAAMISSLDNFCRDNLKDGHVPIFMGGDHSIAAGFLPALARSAREEKAEQFVLWLDAHTDFQTLETTDSGNLHGMPVAYITGDSGLEDIIPGPSDRIKPENICMLGIRSVDPAERDRIARTAIDVHDMRAIDEFGIAAPVRAFINRVREAKGRLHVSLDVDFLDPEIAPAVGTTVPGGVNFREAHMIMEILYESGLVTSLDVSELNPFLDVRGKTSKLIVDLVASLFGRQVLNPVTRSIQS
ncbi:arginase [Sneathiella sp.]|uniref:arginase n=1 Tax=Sneathiella sp. TaxID=1964365 RepID=UPI0035671E5F